MSEFDLLMLGWAQSVNFEKEKAEMLKLCELCLDEDSTFYDFATAIVFKHTIGFGEYSLPELHEAILNFKEV